MKTFKELTEAITINHKNEHLKARIEKVFNIAETLKPVTETLDEITRKLLDKAVLMLKLSVDDVKRCLLVAKAIANLDSSAKIKTEHVAEAIQYREYFNEIKI